jgi:hypothetical protein
MKKHAFLREDEFYETRHIGTRAKNDKICEHCGKIIKKGTPHEMAYFVQSEYQSYPLHTECVNSFRESLN